MDFDKSQSTEYEGLEVEHLRKSTRGLQWCVPRLKGIDDSRGVTKQEAFCWVLFGSSHAKMILMLADSPAFGLSNLMLGMWTYWCLFSASADYATHFNDDGIDHRIYYMCLALAVFFMDVQWTGDVMAFSDKNARRLFLTGLAVSYLIVALMHGRVARWLPACRSYASFHIALNCLSAFLYIVAARSGDFTCEALCWICCLLFLVRERCSPTLPSHEDCDVARKNVHYHVGRIGSLHTTVLALMVKSIAKGVVPGELGSSNGTTMFKCFAFVLFVKVLMFDVHITPTRWHALRVDSTGWRATLWLCLVPVAMSGVMMMGAGCYMVLGAEFTNKQQRDSLKSAGFYFGRGFALMVSALTGKRLLHGRPLNLKPRTRRIWQLQVVVQLVCAMTMAQRAEQMSGQAGLSSCLTMTVGLVALNFVDELDDLSHHGSNWKAVRRVKMLSDVNHALRATRSQHSDDNVV